jgi:hypothetical protein
MLRALIVLLVLLAAIVAGLLLIGGPGSPGEPSGGGPTDVSAAAAASAEDKLERLRSEGVEARLSGAELTSLFLYRPHAWPIGTITPPRVWMSGDTLRLSAAVPTERMPSLPEIDAIRFFLPDTARVDVAGTLRSLGPRAVALEVASLEVAGMPIPARFHPLILDRLGGEDRPEPGSAIFVLPLPAGIRTARVEAGELILTP